MQLNEEIDQQIDKKVSIKQEGQKSRKQISRIIKKTQTQTIKTEAILKERLMSVQAMQNELDRLYRQREIIGQKRDESQKAYYFGQNMRAQIRVEHERE